MTLYRIIVVTFAVLCVAAFLRFSTPGGRRCYANWKMLQVVPQYRPRIALQPVKITLPAMPAVHPVNLGYATVDTGTSSVSTIRTGKTSNGIGLAYEDVRVIFTSPHNPQAPTGKKSGIASTSESEMRAHPHLAEFTRSWDANPVAADISTEEIHLLPYSTIFFMSEDDFLLYTAQLAVKGAHWTEANEVKIFETPNVKGVVWIKKSTTGIESADADLSSSDGTKAISIHAFIPENSPRNISQVIDPILGSFRFTADSLTDPAHVKALIHEAGILPTGAK